MHCFDIIQSNDFSSGKVFFDKKGIALPCHHNVYIRGVTIKDNQSHIPYNFVESVSSLFTEEASLIKQTAFGGAGAAVGGLFGFAMGLLASNHNPKVRFKVVFQDGRSFIAEARERAFETLRKYYVSR